MAQAEIIEINLSAQAKKKSPVGKAWVLNLGIAEISREELLRRDAQGYDLIQMMIKYQEGNKPVGLKWRMRN